MNPKKVPGLVLPYRISLKGLAIAVLTLALCPGVAPARADEAKRPPTPLENLPALAGDYFEFDSKIVGRPFHVFVRLPERYSSEPDARYPVVYVLDGDSLFPIVAPNHLFLHYDEKLPEAVIVGIAYGSFDPAINRRGHDFSAPAPDAGPDHGGAPAFSNFLKNELLPHVESRYRIDNRKRILFGQSRSGYLVLYSAFTDPDLFWGRIASNPSFDPGRERFFEDPAPAERDDLGFVVTSGSRDYPKLREAALAWFEAWGDRPDAPWAIHGVTIEGGSHAAYSATSYRIGMLWLFNRE